MNANIPPQTTEDHSDFVMIRFLDDLNGDGLSDVIGFQHPTRPWSWINTGAPLPNMGSGYLDAQQMLVDPYACVGEGWACDELVDYHEAWDDHSTYDDDLLRHFREDYRLGDVDGDGRTDVFVLVPAGHVSQGFNCADNGRRTLPFIYINNGDGFTPYYAGEPFGLTEDHHSWISYNIGELGCGYQHHLFTHALMDVEGDGTLELAIQTQMDAAGESGVAHIVGTASDRMLSYSNGGTYAYGPLASVHIPADTCVEEACERYGTVVVSHTTSEGRTYTHDYAGLRFDAARQEPLGYEAHRVTASDTGDFTETHFRNDEEDPSGRRSIAGMPVFSFSVLGDATDGFAVEVQETTYDYVELGGGTTHPTSVPVPQVITSRGYEDPDFGCTFPCDEQLVLNMGGVGVLHQTQTTITTDDNATIRHTIALDIALGLHSTDLISVEDSSDPFIVGLPTHIQEIAGAESIHIRNEYDSLGRLKESWQYSGANTTPKTIASYNTRGLPTLVVVDDQDSSTTNPSTTLTYDDGYLTSVTNALGHMTEVVVHPATGDVVLVEDANGRESRRRVDGFARPVLIETPTGRVDNEYVDDGGYTFVSSGAGPEQRVTVDNQGRRVHASVERSGYLAERWYHYRTDGQLDRVIETDPGGDLFADRPVTQMTYDARQRLTKVTRSVGTTTRELRNVSYDGLEVMWTENEDGGTGAGADRRLVRDQGGRLKLSETTSSEGTQSLTYTYNDFGQVTKVLDQAGDAWLHEYDGLGRATRTVDPDSGARRFHYDSFSRLGELRFDSTELMRKFTYDVLGRVTLLEERDEPGQSTHDTTFGWDPAGDVGAPDFTYRQVDDVRRDFGYDAEGRVNEETLTLNGNAHRFFYHFDTLGRLETVTFPGTYKHPSGYQVGYDYTGAGLLDEVRSLHDNALLWRADRYGTSGSVLDETFGNATLTERLVDPLNARVSRITTESLTTGNDLSDVELLWNDDGRLTARRDHAQSPILEETFEYDDLGRLTQWGFAGQTEAGMYAYDGRGNMLSISHLVVDSGGNKNGGWGHGLTYNGRHVDTIDGGIATHDALGRWTQLNGAPSGQDFTADYNRFDLPTQVVRDGTTHAYRYDSGGARVHRSSAGAAGTTSQTDFETAGGRYTEEVDSSGNRTWRHTILGGNGPVLQVVEDESGDREKRFMHRDHLASRTMETDATGNVLETHRTTPFGEALDAGGAPLGFGNTMISGFGGHDHEASAFIDMGGRHFDPSIGRFLTVDPVNADPLNPQSGNGYAYVLNDPASLWDPTGFSPCDKDRGCNGFDPPPGTIDYDLEPRRSNRGETTGNDPARQFTTRTTTIRRNFAWWKHMRIYTQPVVDVQQAAAPRAASPVQGMSLPLVQPRLLSGNLYLESEPFDAPTPRETAWADDESWMTWGEAGEYGLAVAEVGGSMLPLVGEWMDILVIIDDDEPTWVRAISVLSLGANILTAGLLPNFGGTRRAGTRVAQTTASRGARVAGRFCFEAGTLVETPSGRMRIEDLEAGDLVYADDEGDAEVVIREIVQTFQRSTNALIDLVVAYPEDGTESTISGTAEHPFFVPEFGEYVEMGDLFEGMELLGADGEPLVVMQREVREGHFEVFNFEVSDAHNYFVTAPEGRLVGVLVHNSCLDLVARHILQDGTRYRRFRSSLRTQRALVEWLENFASTAQAAERAAVSAGRPAYRFAEGLGEARVFRDGANILISRPSDLVNGGTFFEMASDAAAIKFVRDFL